MPNDLDILIAARRLAAKTDQSQDFEPYAFYTGTRWIFSMLCPEEIKQQLLKEHAEAMGGSA